MNKFRQLREEIYDDIYPKHLLSECRKIVTPLIYTRHPGYVDYLLKNIESRYMRSNSVYMGDINAFWRFAFDITNCAFKPSTFKYALDPNGIINVSDSTDYKYKLYHLAKSYQSSHIYVMNDFRDYYKYGGDNFSMINLIENKEIVLDWLPLLIDQTFSTPLSQGNYPNDTLIKGIIKAVARTYSYFEPFDRNTIAAEVLSLLQWEHVLDSSEINMLTNVGEDFLGSSFATQLETAKILEIPLDRYFWNGLRIGQTNIEPVSLDGILL